nr:LysR substrate-binding domain-containing protein [uncultured Cohaesibacter sp.]
MDKHRKLPPFSAVKAFEAAARHGSFARAAQELNVTSTAISQHVKGLESWLGEALFVRRANKVALTEAGDHYLPEVTRLLDQLATLLPPKQTDASLISLSIALPSDLLEGWLLPNLQDFYQANPQVEIIPRQKSKRAGTQTMEALDFLITDRAIDGSDLLCEPLYEDAIQPVCSQQYRDLLGLQDPYNWRPVTLLHDVHCEGDWSHWAEKRASLSLDWQSGLKYPNQWLALEAAKQGRGVFMAHRQLARPALADGSLVALDATPLPTGRSMQLVRQRGHISPAAIQFRSWIITALGRG